MKPSSIVFHTFNGGLCFFGLTIVVLGTMSRLSENMFGSDGSDKAMRQADSVIAVLGLSLMLMSFLGYVGTFRKTEATEYRGTIYISALFVLFWALIGAGSFALHYCFKFRNDQQLLLFDDMLFYWNTRIPGTLQRMEHVDKIQRALKCCGFYDASIFPDIRKHGLPRSCCADKSMLNKDGACPEGLAYEDGCIGKGIRTVENANFVLGIFVIVTAGFALSAVIFNVCWKRTIWSSSKKETNEAMIVEHRI